MNEQISKPVVATAECQRERQYNRAHSLRHMTRTPKIRYKFLCGEMTQSPIQFVISSGPERLITPEIHWVFQVVCTSKYNYSVLIEI